MYTFISDVQDWAKVLTTQRKQPHVKAEASLPLASWLERLRVRKLSRYGCWVVKHACGLVLFSCQNLDEAVVWEIHVACSALFS